MSICTSTRLHFIPLVSRCMGFVPKGSCVFSGGRPRKGIQLHEGRGGRSRLTFTNQVSLKSHVAQYCRLRNARLVQYSPLTVFGLFHYLAPALSP